MAREWSERHIRDLVRSEWDRLGGGGGGESDDWTGKDGLFSKMMTEFVLGADGALGKTGGLPSVLLDQWTEDIDRSGVRYHYKRMEYKVKVTNTSLNISRPSGQLIPSTVYDIHYEIEGSINIPDPDDQMYTNCNGWINSFVQCSLPSGIGDFGTTKYYLGTILEGVGANVLWLPIDYVNCGNDITIEETKEEFVLRTYTNAPNLLCIGIATNSKIDTSYTGSRTFRKSRNYRVRLSDTGNITTEEA